MNYYFLGLQLVYIKLIVILLNMNIMQKTKPKVKVRLFLIFKICLELWLECLNFVSFFKGKSKKKPKNSNKNKKPRPYAKEITHCQAFSTLCSGYFKVLCFIHFSFFFQNRPNMDNKNLFILFFNPLS